MKKRIRKTGEIIDVISYGGKAKERNEVLDYVSYIDSKGGEHPNAKLNFYWDLEDLDEFERFQNSNTRPSIDVQDQIDRTLFCPSYRFI